MMQEGNFPDEFLFSKILQACGNRGDFESGRLILSLVIRSVMSCLGGLIMLYWQCMLNVVK